MTERQRLALVREAKRHLELTEKGWLTEPVGAGTQWKAAMKALDRLEADLEPSPVPDLGPVWHGGKSVLLHDLTHATSGIPLYPAFDDAFAQGIVIIAPEHMTVCKQPSSANPGEAFYACGQSKIDYWFGHLDRSHAVGTKFRKGDAIGKVVRNTIGGGPHVHVGVNVERLLGKGKQLVHHTDYTHGAPLIGVQLRKALA